jgi:hypothetical protein
MHLTLEYGARSPCCMVVCFTPVNFSAPCKFTSFGSLCSFTLVPYFWWEYNFLFLPFSFIFTFSGMQKGHETRAGCILLLE